MSGVCSEVLACRGSMARDGHAACEKGGAWGEALARLGSMAACEKGGAWGEALVNLGSMARDQIDADTITYSAAISAYEKGGLPLGSMARNRMDRNTITYSAAISACEEGQCGDA